MSNVESNIVPSSFRRKIKLHSTLRIIALGTRRRHVLDAHSLTDHLRRDIGLPPSDIAVDREICMANVNLRAGMISPRPC